MSVNLLTPLMKERLAALEVGDVCHTDGRPWAMVCRYADEVWLMWDFPVVNGLGIIFSDIDALSQYLAGQTVRCRAILSVNQ